MILGSLAATAVGCVRVSPGRAGDRRNGFTEAEYAALMDAAHQQPGGPLLVIRDNRKRSLANLAKRDLAQLTALVKTRLRRMRYRPGLLEGFLASTCLDLKFFSTPHH
jgi:hypothetical protein